MPNIVTLNPASVDFTVDGSGNYAVKHWLNLEAAALRFDGIPDDAEIVRAWIVSEQMVEYPSNCYGDVTWGVVSKLYVDLSGIPAQERCQPIGTGLLGRLRFKPGWDTMDWREYPEGIAYAPGDRLGIFPQISGAPGRAVSIFTGLRLRSATGFVALPGIVHHDLLNSSTSGNGAYSFRSIFTNIPDGGTEARVTVQSLADGLSLSGMSIGVQTGAGYDMAATPVPVTFDSAAPLTLGAFESKRSDWVALNTTAGNALLVHSCVSGSWAYKNRVGSDSTCYVAGTGGLGSASFSGTVQPDRAQVVAMIEVR